MFRFGAGTRVLPQKEQILIAAAPAESNKTSTTFPKVWMHREAEF